MPRFYPSRDPEPPPDPPPADTTRVDPAEERPDLEDDPVYDEVESVDHDEFGELIDESQVDDDADDWDKTEI